MRRLLHLILLLGLFLLFAVALVGERTLIPASAALVIAPQGALVEQLSGDPLERALARAQGSPIQETLVRDVLEALEAARDDERIKAVVLDLDAMTGGGLSKLQEIRAALGEFKESGKPVIAILRDFVELSSQIFEHWAVEPEVLKKHARHVETGAPIPDALIDRLKRAQRFNQGFETVEYTACALVDMALHSVASPAGVDISEFERAELARLGMPEGIVMRHRLPHCGHLFSSASYAAGYYVCMWAEVLDADGSDAFVEAGDPFDPALAARLLKHVYSAGNSVEPRAAYRAWAGGVRWLSHP